MSCIVAIYDLIDGEGEGGTLMVRFEGRRKVWLGKAKDAKACEACDVVVRGAAGLVSALSMCRAARFPGIGTDPSEMDEHAGYLFELERS